MMPKEIRLGGCVRWDPEIIDCWIAAGAPDRKMWESQQREGQRTRRPGAAEPSPQVGAFA